MNIGSRSKIILGATGGLVLFGAAALAASFIGSRGCAAISPSTAKRLAEYVRGKARLPAESALELAYSEPVGETCYQAVHLRVKDRPGPDLLVFLSPDQQFLSRDLMNWKTDRVLNSGRGLPENLQNAQNQTPPKLTDAEFNQMIDSTAPTKGSSAAPIRIALFTDFQCPYCKQQAQVLKEGLRETEAQIVFHHLPLNSHPWARPAAEMAECVARQNNTAFWDLFDGLYQNQETLTPETLQQFVRKRLSGQKEVSLSGFDACMAEHRSAQRVDDDVALARKHTLRATPTMFINGVRTQGVVTAEEIRRIASVAGELPK